MLWRRPLACLLVGVWLVATPVAGLLHSGRERHRYCVDHGQFEDVTAAAAHDVGPLPAARADGGHDLAHHACPFQGAAAGPRPGAARAHAVVLALAPAPVRAFDAPAASIPLLRLAPKGSPPARP